MYAQISIQSKTPGDPSEDLGILGISLFLSLSLKVPPLQCSVHKFQLSRHLRASLSDFLVRLSVSLCFSSPSCGGLETGSEQLGQSQGSPVCFFSLRDLSPVLLVTQCVKNIVLFVLPSFLLVYSVRAIPITVNRSWVDSTVPTETKQEHDQIKCMFRKKQQQPYCSVENKLNAIVDSEMASSESVEARHYIDLHSGKQPLSWDKGRHILNVFNLQDSVIDRMRGD